MALGYDPSTNLGYLQNGRTITITAGAAISSGDLVQVGSLHGVAVTDAAIGETVELALDGVYGFPKDNAVGSAVAAVGDPVYFLSGEVTGDDNTGANLLVGHAYETANDAATSLIVRLRN